MDRSIFYPGEIPRSSDVLKAQKYAMTAIAKLSSALFGTSTLLNGLACTPTSPASMTVQVAAGEIYALASMDATDYGSVVADTTHQILKQGIVLDTQTFSTPAPATSGHAINYLIQVGYADQDKDSAVLPYYNASNPSVAWSGPLNTGEAQPTTRKGACVVSIKTGVSALAGTQVTPTPDVGYVGAWVVTVLQGATTVVSGNISQYPNAPFLTETLLNKISQATADTRYAQITKAQNGSYVYAEAGGSVNAYTATLNPAPASLVEGMPIYVDFGSVGSNTASTSTLSVNGLGVLTIVKQYTNQTTGATTLIELAVNDLPKFGQLQYSSASGGQWVLLNPAQKGRLINVQKLLTAGTSTYTKTAGMTFAIVEAQGAGGGGGGAGATGVSQASGGGGGSAGGYGKSILTRAEIDAAAPITITVGAKGTGSAGANGTDGGTSSFGSFISCTGGKGANAGVAVTPPLAAGNNGNGGSSTGGNILNVDGMRGTTAVLLTSGSTLGGYGGQSPFGGNGTPGSNLAGGNAQGYGSGGGGATNYASQSAKAGGNGGDGAVFIYEYA